MRTEIIIVNYRTADLTCDCIRSIVHGIGLRDDVHITLVDNASGDQSEITLRRLIQAEGLSDHVSLLPLDKNGGFAVGNNQGIRQTLMTNANADWYWLLNPDTIVRDGALDELLEFAKKHPKVGIVGSRLEDLDATPQHSAFRFPSILSEFDEGLRLGIISRLLRRHRIAPPISDAPHPTDWVAGASMLIRREVFEQVGMLDEDYFMYYEELDFCLQAKRVGWECWYVPSSRVVHLVGKSSGINDVNAIPKRRPQYWFDSRRRYFLKNHGVIYSGLVDGVWLASYALWYARSKWVSNPRRDPPGFFWDSLRNSVFVRGSLR